MIRELALAGTILIGLSLGTAVAQDQPPPPATFWGSVKEDGQNVTDGTPVIALVGDQVCAEASREPGQKGTWTASADDPQYGIHAGDSIYVVEVPADSQVPGCGREGATVTFKIGDRTAQQMGLWIAGPNHLSLTAGTPSGQPSPATPSGGQAPTPPAAAEQEQSDSGFKWWWPAAIGAGAVLVAGAALTTFLRARRSAGG